MTTPIEKYAEIQAMVQKEARDIALKVYREEGTRYGVGKVPLHYHNNIDSPNIPESSINPSLKASGSLALETDGQQYKLNLTFKPKQILFYGNAVHRTLGSIDVRAQAIGSAELVPSYFFQPENTTTVSPSNIIGNVIQSGSYLLVEDTTPRVNTSATEGHLVQVIYTGSIGTKLTDNIVAQITIPNAWTQGLGASFDYSTKGYGQGYVLFDVDLAPGWEINGNFVVT